MSVKIISRSNGHSSVAAAAYRSGEKLEDTRTGEVHDYTRKQKVDHSEILIPENCGVWALDRENLWNTTEHTEKRKDAQLAREINIAIPVELNSQQGRDLVKNYVQENFVNKGMIADISIHGEGTNNPHAHIMLSTREATPDGLGQKVRAWNDKAQLESWRGEWANSCNDALVRSGHDVVIDHRSFERRGIDKIPSTHVGSYATKLENRGIESNRGDLNRQIKSDNKEIELAKYQLEKLNYQIEIEKEREAEPSEVLEEKFAHCYKYGLTPESTRIDAISVFDERMKKESQDYAKEKKQIEDNRKRYVQNSSDQIARLGPALERNKGEIDRLKGQYQSIKSQHDKTLIFGKKNLAEQMDNKAQEHDEAVKKYKELSAQYEEAKKINQIEAKHRRLFEASPERQQLKVIDQNRAEYNQMKMDLKKANNKTAALEKLRKDRERDKARSKGFER